MLLVKSITKENTLTHYKNSDFFAKQNIFVGSRQYKNDNQVYAKGVIEIIEKIYGKVFDLHDGYSMENMQKYAQKLVSQNSRFAYNDIHLYSGISKHIWALVPKGFDPMKNDYERIDINHTHIYCIDCGEKLLGCNCVDNDWVHCHSCRGDDENCSYCEVCNEYHRNEDVTYVESVDMFVCYDCIDEYFSCCEICGEYHRNEDIIRIENSDEYVCHDCFEEYFSYCEICGECHSNDYMTYVENKGYVCTDCKCKEH